MVKIYTNQYHEIIGRDPDHIPKAFDHEYEIDDYGISYLPYVVLCGYMYEPVYALDFDETGNMQYDDQGNPIYKLDDEGEKILLGYSLRPFVDKNMLDRLKHYYDSNIKETKILHTAAAFAAETFTDSQALAVKELYPDWDDLPEGTHLETGQRVRYQGRLHKVTTAHERQATWTPTDAPTLFEAIDEAHTGTLEDPIPATPNMEYFEGKYYSEGGTVYRCTRGTGIPIAQLPGTLVGIYFEIVEEV